MKIIRAKDYADMSRKAANIISAQVIMKPDCVLGLATGGTPWAPMRSWWSATTREIWIFLRSPPSIWPESYWSFMHRNLFDHVNIDPKINLPDGTNPGCRCRAQALR